MAQLYKMTLYVCDLQDNLSLDEIKTLIEEDALDGVSVDCICHFANEQVGAQVEWDDDIDLNRIDCPTPTWENISKTKNQEVELCITNMTLAIMSHQMQTFSSTR